VCESCARSPVRYMSALADGVAHISRPRRHSLSRRASGTVGSVDLPSVHCPDYLLVRGEGSEKQITARFSGNPLSFEIHQVHRCLANGLTESPLLPLAESLAIARTLDRVRAQLFTASNSSSSEAPPRSSRSTASPTRTPPSSRNDRDELRKLFEDHNLPSDYGSPSSAENDRAHQALEDTDQRITRLQDIRDQTGLLQFRERGASTRRSPTPTNSAGSNSSGPT
jgi:hypothetical protein